MKKLVVLAAILALIPSAALAATFNRNLSYGTTSSDVSNLQQFLKDEGLYSSSITATFGPMTERALIAFQEQEGISATGYFGSLTRADANAILAAHPEWTTTISNPNTYKNVNGNTIQSPTYSSNGIPACATAQCNDGTYSCSLHRSGTCSGHHGVATWL